jgi:hypothetical protein
MAERVAKADREYYTTLKELSKLQKQYEYIMDLGGQLAEQKLTLKELQNQLPGIGEVCPLCKQMIRRSSAYQRGNKGHIEKHL